MFYILVSPYDPDSQFSRSALSRLEAARIPVLSSLAKIDGEQLEKTIGLSIGDYDDTLDRWIESCNPPTWKSLYDVLKELDLEELSEQIEEYLGSKWLV